MEYDFKRIEKKWQKRWEKEKIFEVKEGKGKKKLEAWASRRYSNPLVKIIFDKSLKGE